MTNKPCPATSPESRNRCILEDTEIDHWMGHEATDKYHNGIVSWATNTKDKARWRAND